MTQRMLVLRGERLRAARERADLTQERLADKLKTSKAQINRYETGKQDPSAELLVKLARELHVSTDWLLGLVNEEEAKVQPLELSPTEQRLLAAFRQRDLENLMRAAIERGGPKPDDEVVAPGK
jgi:transcriptional regulator with XRE-family HTH domain